MKKCENCGFDKNQDKQKFCMKCGKPLDAAVNKELADEVVKEENTAPSQQKAVKLEKPEAGNTSGLSPIPEFDFESKSISASVSKAKKAVGDTASEAKKGYQKHKTLINIIICIIAAIIILAIIIPAVVSKIKESNYQNQLKDSYSQAVSLFDSGNYSEANEIFITLGDYEDSKNLALESVYQNGLKLAEEKKYNDAINEFGKILNYSNSAALYDKYEKYAEAYQLYESGDYSKAVTAFEKIGDEEMANDIRYSMAVNEMNKEEYLSALSEFKKISGYKDSDEKYKECAYAYAMEQYDLGKYKNAEYYFKMLGDYKDSQEKLKITSKLADEAEKNEEIYKEATDLLRYKNYNEAAEKFKSLGDYKDSAEKAKEAEKLYQDSLPKVTNEPISENEIEIKFKGGTVTFTEYLYYISDDSGETMKSYYCGDNVDFNFYGTSDAEKIIEQKLSADTHPDFTKYNAYNETSSYINYMYNKISDAWTHDNKYLFVRINKGEYAFHGFTMSTISGGEIMRIFDMSTGDELSVHEVFDIAALTEAVADYAVDYIARNYDPADYGYPDFEGYFNYNTNDLYYSAWLEDGHWSIDYYSDEVLIEYQDLFIYAYPSDRWATVRYPLSQFEKYIK